MQRAAGLGLLFLIIAWLAWNVGVAPTSGKSLPYRTGETVPDVAIENVHFVAREPGEGREQRLLSWVYEAHPWQFDVVAVVQNTMEREIPTVVIDGSLRYKTGRILPDREQGVTDYDASMRAADWKDSLDQRVHRTTTKLAPGEQRSVVVATVDVRGLWLQVEPEGLWPWLLEATLSIGNESSYQAVLPILSGD